MLFYFNNLLHMDVRHNKPQNICGIAALKSEEKIIQSCVVNTHSLNRCIYKWIICNYDWLLTAASLLNICKVMKCLLIMIQWSLNWWFGEKIAQPLWRDSDTAFDNTT